MIQLEKFIDRPSSRKAMPEEMPLNKLECMRFFDFCRRAYNNHSECTALSYEYIQDFLNLIGQMLYHAARSKDVNRHDLDYCLGCLPCLAEFEAGTLSPEDFPALVHRISQPENFPNGAAMEFALRVIDKLLSYHEPVFSASVASGALNRSLLEAVYPVALLGEGSGHESYSWDLSGGAGWGIKAFPQQAACPGFTVEIPFNSLYLVFYGESHRFVTEPGETIELVEFARREPALGERGTWKGRFVDVNHLGEWTEHKVSFETKRGYALRLPSEAASALMAYLREARIDPAFRVLVQEYKNTAGWI